MDPSAPGWYPDPYGRHERRYWSGIRWSRHVDDGGHRSEDPIDTGPVATVPIMAPQRPDQQVPMALIAGALAVVLLAGAAFVLLRGGGDDGPEEISQSDPVTVTVVAAMKERAQGQIPDDRAACMADALISVVGKDRLIELDVLNGADPVVSIDEADKDIGIPKAMDCLDNDQLTAFMGATWRDDNDQPVPAEQSSCIFGSWLAGLGRERLVYLYRSFADLTPPALQDVLNENELELVVGTAARCAAEAEAQAEASASSTVAPATP